MCMMRLWRKRREGGRCGIRRLLILLLVACARHDDPPLAAQSKPETRCVNEWEQAAPGVEYRMLNCTPSRFDLHLVRVDPKVARIDAVVQQGSTATDLGRQVMFAINANFFDEQFRPLGVVVSDGRQVNPAHPVSWQSVFFVDRDQTPHIVPVKE